MTSIIGRAKGEDSWIETVTSSTFDAEVLHGEGPIAVEFMSYGCGNCRAIEPVLEDVAKMLKGRERVFRVNVAVDPDLPSAYGIAGTPTFVMFLDGQEVGRAEGPRPTSSGLMNALTQPFGS